MKTRKPRIQDKEKNKSSVLFRSGSVCLVFLVIGYQGALFINRAAVLHIEANRDRPDTVFIVREIPSEHRSADTGARGGSYGDGHMAAAEARGNSYGSDTFRRNASHSPDVSRVRAETRKVESFRFNPNSAGIEDLMRLGFSERQAQSIENYRKSGGRFHRKEDFAKSFVVSDSIYRRLEKYIDIPLTDINKADSAAFDALPGIGPFYAARMVEYRQSLGGYSYTEQLMDIWNFDEGKYGKLKDLICCSPARPMRLWQMPADSLRLHPYIRGYREAEAIVLLRNNYPRDSLCVDLIRRAGILGEEDCRRLAGCIIAAP